MSITSVPDPDMVAKSAVVAEAFTPENYAYLLSLLPTPHAYSKLHDRFETSYAASLKGDPEKVKTCEADRQAINRDLSILLGLAKVFKLKDPTVAERLGLARLTVRTAAPAVLLSVPLNFKVIYSPTGKIIASIRKVAGAKAYEVWACDGDPNLESNWRLIASSPRCRGIVINGLNTGKTNWLRIRGLRGNSAGPWSNCVSL